MLFLLVGLGISIGQKMLLLDKRILQEKLETLEKDCQCQTTKQLITLVIHMTSFEPKDRPNFNEVFLRFLPVKESGKSQKDL